MRGLGGISFIALLVACGPALAGDIYDAPLRPSLLPQNGFTVGLIGGYGFGNAKVGYESTSLSGSGEGFDGGILFGYDFETDGYFTAFELAGLLGGPSDTISVGEFTEAGGIDGHVDARIRAGYRSASGLGLSAIGGLSINHVSNNLSDGTKIIDGWQFGWLVGVAADYMLTPNLSVGAEYTYNQLFNKTYHNILSPGDAAEVGGNYNAFRLTTRLKI